MITDEIRALARTMGLSTAIAEAERKRSNAVHGSVTVSDAAIILGRIEKKLGLNTSSPHPLGMRFRIAETRYRLALLPGDRVRIEGSTAAQYNGREGAFAYMDGNGRGALIKLDNDVRGPRYFTLDSIRKVTKNMPIVNQIKQFASTLIMTAVPSTPAIAARELLAATTLCSVGDAAKKRAKKALVDLGITLAEYRPGTVSAYEDEDFLIEAVTKEPTETLDKTLLLNMMMGAGLSQTRAQRVIADSMKPSKAATSIVVTEK